MRDRDERRGRCVENVACDGVGSIRRIHDDAFEIRIRAVGRVLAGRYERDRWDRMAARVQVRPVVCDGAAIQRDAVPRPLNATVQQVVQCGQRFIDREPAHAVVRCGVPAHAGGAGHLVPQ